MRVVWITHNYPRFAGDVAGGFLHPLAVALRAREVDVRVVAPSDAGMGGRDELDGVPVRRVRYGSVKAERIAYRGTMASAITSPGGLLSLWRLQRALHRGALAEWHDGAGGPRLIHAHWWIPAGLAAPHAGPMVLTCHGTDVRLLQRNRLARRIARPTFRRATLVTTVSRSLAAAIERDTGVTVATDAIQPMPVARIERPWSDRTGGWITMGRLTAQKRVDLAIRALALVRTRQPSARMIVVGDGTERDALTRLAADLGIADAVDFVGAISPEMVPEYFAHATCCLVPARDEGFGLAAAEALMQGVPVVACDNGGGLMDIVPVGGAGRVVPADAAAIAAAAEELTCGDDAYRAARTDGAMWRDRLAPEAVADRCITWYRRALDA